MAFSDWLSAAVGRIWQKPNSTAPTNWNPDSFDTEAFLQKLRDDSEGDGFFSSGTPEESERFFKGVRKAIADIDHHTSLRARMLERIPEDLFLRTPSLISEEYKENANFQEDLWVFWEEIETHWPEPPKSDIDRQECETNYWKAQAATHSYVNERNIRQLRPKQDIIDFWSSREKWIFRQYYAATGIVHRSIYEDPHFIYNLSTYYAVKDKEDHEGLPLHRNLTNKTFGVVETYISTLIPQHKEKWGEWFFFNVDQAFQKTYGKPERNFGRPSDEL